MNWRKKIRKFQTIEEKKFGKKLKKIQENWRFFFHNWRKKVEKNTRKLKKKIHNWRKKVEKNTRKLKNFCFIIDEKKLKKKYRFYKML